MLSRAFVIAALVWPLVLASGWIQRAHRGGGTWHAVVYAAASRVCHQRPERSFHTADVQWPVCGRCSGLYLAAPIGALVGLGRGRWRYPARAALVLAAIPTALTIVVEWMTPAVGNLTRAVAALPLGAVSAAVVARTAAGRSESIK
jgi:uncharacterized membrane protein